MAKSTSIKAKKTWSFPENSFAYSGVDYDSDYRSSGNCDCDYICRCSRYYNLRVTKVDVSSLVSTIVGNEKYLINPTFFKYCVDRILRINKIYKTEFWDISTCGGYYGEEIDRISCNIYNELKEQVVHCYSLKPEKRINYVLNLEYNFILDILKDKKFREVVVSPKDIICNKEYIKKVESEYSKEKYNLPIGVCIKQENNKYRLIDGYHRFLANFNKKEITIIEAY